MRPQDVISPRRSVSELDVIVEEKDFSMASLKWNGKSRIAIRWNGEGESMGFPVSRGHPTWFVIPKQVALEYAQKSNNHKLEAVIRASSDDPFA